LTFAGGARAADPEVSIEVKAKPDTVNLSLGNSTTQEKSTTQAAYQVTIVNNSTNVLNNVGFEAATHIDLDTAPGTKYVEDDSAQCVATIDAARTPIGVRCNFGQLRGARQGGPNSASFTVVFEAPSAGQKLLLKWTATYQEGGTDNNGNSSPSNDSQTGTVETVLVTSTSAQEDRRLRSYFAASTGALLFTGTGVPSGLTSGDAWTTTVTIPKGHAGEAQIVEDDNSGNSCGPVLPLCLRSAISVPGSFSDPSIGFLVITLRRDASTIPKGAKIDDAPLLYEPGSLDTEGEFHKPFPDTPGFPVRLKLCSALAGGAPSLPRADASDVLAAAQQMRCIKSFKVYPNNSKTPASQQGDWEWVIWAIENGRISF
jgi:hypothetical protein